MTDLTLPDVLVERLQWIAQREQRPLDEVIEILLDCYNAPEPSMEDLLRQDRLRVYARARRYWQQVGDPRQHLSDSELDEQFWLIDHEGIPRLKSEEGTIDLPDNPLLKMLEMSEADKSIEWKPFTSSPTESIKDMLNREYTDHLLARLDGSADADE